MTRENNEQYFFSSAVPVTNFFLKQSWSEGRNITTMKLLKILWFAYGFWYALSNKKLFIESFQAWKYGPVLPSTYHEFKRFGAYPIEKGTYSYDFDPYEEDEPHKNIIKDNKKLTDFLKKIWDMYGRFSANELVDLTHQEGTPWHNVYRDGEYFIEIPDDEIKQYFEKQVKLLLGSDND